MKKNLKYDIAALCVSLFLPLSAQAQLIGTDTVPGAACTAKGSVRMTANAGGPGAHILTCDGDSDRWIATLNVELPAANTQIANKQYVDAAMTRHIPPCTDNATELCLLETPRMSGDPEFTPENIAQGVNILGVTGTLTSSGCIVIGDLCADGTVYAGYHPTLRVPLYIPATDQGTTSAWKISIGANDIITDSIDDGRANTNQVANSATFPAFKQCKDLAAGGHSDWYLPSLVELYYLWSVSAQIQAKGNITNFQSVDYWSSTEQGTNNATYQVFGLGAEGHFAKNNGFRVRCMRR